MLALLILLGLQEVLRGLAQLGSLFLLSTLRLLHLVLRSLACLGPLLLLRIRPFLGLRCQRLRGNHLVDMGCDFRVSKFPSLDLGGGVPSPDFGLSEWW